MFLPLSIFWLVCQQNYTKTTEPVSMKFGWRVEGNHVFFPYFLYHCEVGSFDILLISHGIMLGS